MDDYKTLEKVLGSKYCPDCNRILGISENFAVCKRCGFSQELLYRDEKRNKETKSYVQYRKIEKWIDIDTE
jgi:DNA-directed RNA polymerase subunit M/transcription elongation factor TFIIS